MKATLALSVLFLLVSCGESVKKDTPTQEVTQQVISKDSIGSMIAELEREKDRLLESSNSENPIIVNLDKVIDSLKALQ